VKVRVFLTGRFSTCTRTVTIRETEPSDQEIVDSLVRDLGDRRGPMFEKLNLPEHVLWSREPLYANMTVIIDNDRSGSRCRIYSVRTDGTPYRVFDDGQKKIFEPTELDF